LVRRWDAVAGGAGADWATCLRLLERAAAADDVARDGASTLTSMTNAAGMAPTPDSEEASAALAGEGRRRPPVVEDDRGSSCRRIVKRCRRRRSTNF